MSEPTPTHVSERECDVVVRTRRLVAEDVVELTLESTDGHPLPAWTPGAHVDLILDDGLVRQYSLCSSLSDDTYRIAVLRTPDSRGGSSAVHALTEGATVRIRGPRNNFPLERSPRYLFVAGGIGITPLMPMIEEAAASGADWQLHYGGRSRSSMAFLDALEQHGERVHVVPQDEQGILDLESILGSPDGRTTVYCCGPAPLLAAVEERCHSWPPGSLHLERFTAKEVVRESADATFDVVLQRSGITLTVGAETSVFDAVRAAGVSVLGSCLEGICGTCETSVLEGEVDHRDSVLDEEEQEAMDTMMICVSRCRGDQLVLDL
jgi:ferredoxin-NADP reductase